MPAEVLQRRQLLANILPVYEKYGYQQIETPAFEDIERLIGSEGGDNEKLIYKIMRRGVEWPPASEADAVDLGLRYDLTVPLARFYATHSNDLLSPFRAIQVGPVWRAERPQKGRYRQFVQCDIDILGESNIDAEVELIAGGAEAIAACGLNGFTVRLNDRRLLRSLVVWAGFSDAQETAVLVALDKLDKIGVSGVADQLKLIDDGGAASSKLADLAPVLEEVRGLDMLFNTLPVSDESIVKDLESIISGVQTATDVELDIEIDPTLVRGQGYYTGTIFEVEHGGSAGSVAGGGRYDRMIGKLSGVDTPAAGISIGFERLWDLLGSQLVDTATQRVVLLHSPNATVAEVQTAAADLRRVHDVVRTERVAKNFKAQLGRLRQNGFTHWVELKGNTGVELRGNTTDLQTLPEGNQ